ncbi:MAG TPA: hypothetical protein VEV15_09120, partial [Flavisolibacter sp.]|nr:hypothetical protein [Flavisolibacter sp.]
KLRESKNYQHTADTVKGLKRSYKNSKDASANNLSRYKVVGKETLKDAHEAGMKGLKEAAMLSGGISAAQNLTQVVKGEKELGKAVIDTAVDTAKGTAMSYGVKASGAIVKAGAKKAGEQLGSKTLQAFANSARGPALLVTTTLEVGKSLKKYMDGDLDSKDLFIELGEKGTGIIFAEAGTVLGEIVGVSAGAAIGGLIGTFLLPGVGTAGGAAIGAKIGAIAGPIIGSMVGYMVGTQLYQAAKNLLSSYDSEKQRRLKAIYEQAYERMKAERLEMERLIEQHFADRYAMFRQGFQAMEEAILENNVHKVSNELNDILGAFGETLQFKNFKQFDDFMLDDDMVLKL